MKKIEKIRHITRKIFKKKNIYEKCGFKGYTEFHHITLEIFHIQELCSMCHRNSKQSIKKKRISELIKAIKASA